MIEKYSWPRRSGKTGAAIMRAKNMGCHYYSCGFIPNEVRDLSWRARSIKGLSVVVVDNYEFATDEELEIMETIPHVVVFGTMGPIPDAKDYKTVDSTFWLMVQDDIKEGIISLKWALIEYNFTCREDV